MKIPAYQRLTRKAKLRSRLRGFKDITDSANGLQASFVRIDLGPEAVDEDVDDVGLRIEAVVKYMLEDHRLGDGAAGVAQEVFEQGKFAALQLDFFAGAHGFAGKEVEFDVAAGEASGFDALGGAADEGVEAREQFGKSKRFGEVIVTPRLEAFDAVVHGGACAKDDDGRGNFFGAHALDEAKAIEPGRHEVDDGGIVGSGFGVGEGVFA